MKIAWYTAGGHSRASSRLRAWWIGERLPPEFSVTFNSGPAARVADLIVVQKVCRDDVMSQLGAWVDAGKTVVWDVDDWVESAAIPRGVHVTTGMKYLLDRYAGFRSATYLPGLADVSPNHPVKTTHAATLGRVVWYGDELNQRHAAAVREACGKLGLSLRMITNPTRPLWPGCRTVEYRRWDLATVDQDIIDCDVVACPFMPSGPNDHWTLCKGENKLAKAWSLGMPVIGTAIRSYEAYGLRHQATTVEEWSNALVRLWHARDREEDAAIGRELARASSPPVVIPQWVDYFTRVANGQVSGVSER
ncbi:MAG: hypothetical protein IT428_17230 [Planctomycetaceae bacterium]|nr:hypothetical protein [Planctomycetaceae bacterium]